MAAIYRSNKYKVRPVTKAVILLVLLASFATFSAFNKREEDHRHQGRTLLNVVEGEQKESEVEEEIGSGHEEEGEEEKKEEQKEEKGVEGSREMIIEHPYKNGTKVDCLQPAIKQFPRTPWKKEARQNGWVIVHILVATYMFVGLAIVCDDFFVPALTRVSDALGLSPDVAGATFMAAGSSAPELATSVIGVFVAQDDIGVSGVVGSAVFNITLVIAVCALFATHAIVLNWYSVCRDCFSYLICICALIWAIFDKEVTWVEATAFLVMYVLYCIAMGFNSTFEAWAMNLPVPDSWKAAGATAGNFDNQCPKAKEAETRIAADGTTEIILTPVNEEKKLDDALKYEDPLRKPLALDDGRWAVFCWYVQLPLTILTVITVPDCRKRGKEHLFVISFLCSVFWICLYSYVMVWMITIIGTTFGIPDTVMGLTFIAAGVSVPDALSGIAVVKEGHGDMAVSNAIGSNVFDILVCLGVPWFIKTVIQDPGSTVKVVHRGILYSTFTLFSTVVFLIGASHANGWKMDKKYGLILLIWYFVVMLFASLYETNALGNFNPVECVTDD